MPLTFQPETEARLVAAAEARGKTPDEVVAAWLDVLPAAAHEDDLLREIAQGFPETFWERYRTLIARRQAQTLTPDEQAELIGLSDKVEERTLRRTRALVELSQRRGQPLNILIQQMDIRPTSVNP